ncbi:MAG: extracellular solute-binding protein [Janthinobacterium lividum]
MNIFLKSLTLLSLLIFFSPQSSKAAEVTDPTAFSHVDIYHPFDKEIGEHFERILKKFNAVSPKFQVIAKSKNSSKDDSEAIIAQKDLAQESPLVWISSDKISEMSHQNNAYVPLAKLMNVKRGEFIPIIYQYASSPKAIAHDFQLISLPFACSTPILFFNKTAFEEAGLDPKLPPQTWEQLEQAITKLKKVGYTGLAITGGFLKLLENFSAVHNLPLVAKKETPSLKSIRTTLQTKPYQDYFKRLAQWNKEGLYVPFENDDQIYEDFTGGNIGIILADAHQQEMLIEKIKKGQDDGKSFKLGVGPYPYLRSLTSKPFAMPIQGDTLWITTGHEEDHQGIALFLNYLLSPEVQAEWHQRTGYLPMTLSAYRQTHNAKFYDTNPVHRISTQQIMNRQIGASQTSLQWYLNVDDQKSLTHILDGMLIGEGA